MNYLARQILKVFQNLPFFFACLVPKQKDLWLFSAWHGKKYADNPKALFKYCVENTQIKAFWISSDASVVDDLMRKGLPALRQDSLMGIWMQLRAGIIVYTHAHHTEFTSYLIGHRTKKIQSWHGLPLKKIGVDDLFNSQSSIKRFLTKILTPHLNEVCDLILCAGNIDKEIFSRALQAKKNAAVITGYPRNDILVRTSIFEPESRVGNTRFYIYMPTFRSPPGTEFPFLQEKNFNAQKISDLLYEHNIELHIKLHPVQRINAEVESKINRTGNIKFIRDGGDVYEALHAYDGLITDYSSIFFDFLLTKRPVYFLAPDLQSYISSDREMYFDYHKVTPSHPKYSWEEIIEYITTSEYPWWQHAEVLKRFHQYTDGRSTARSFEEIIKIQYQSAFGSSASRSKRG